MQTLAGTVGQSDFGIITASRVRSLAPAEKICLAYVAHYTVLPPGVECNRLSFYRQTRNHVEATCGTHGRAPAVTRRALLCKILMRHSAPLPERPAGKLQDPLYAI